MRRPVEAKPSFMTLGSAVTSDRLVLAQRLGPNLLLRPELSDNLAEKAKQPRFMLYQQH